MKIFSFYLRLASTTLAILVILSACSDEHEPPTSIGFADMLMSVDREPYGFLSTTAHHKPTSPEPIYYSLDGAVSTLPKFKGRADGGTMTIAGIDLNSNPAISFVYRDVIYPEPGLPHPTFGAINNFALEGNPQTGVPAFSTTMYLPAELKILSPELSDYDSKISKSQGLAITWNSDPNNTLGVAIALMHIPESPEAGASILWHTVEDDDGSYMLTGSDLQDFSAGQSVQIGVARMNYKIHSQEDKDYTLYAIAQSLSLVTIVD